MVESGWQLPRNKTLLVPQVYCIQYDIIRYILVYVQCFLDFSRAGFVWLCINCQCKMEMARTTFGSKPFNLVFGITSKGGKCVLVVYIISSACLLDSLILFADLPLLKFVSNTKCGTLDVIPGFCDRVSPSYLRIAPLSMFPPIHECQ